MRRWLRVLIFIHEVVFLSAVVAGELPAESFETEPFPPAGWTKFTDFGGSGWMRGEVGTQIPGFGAGALFDAPPGGGNFVAFTSWATGDADGDPNTGQPTDQWLITPQISNIQAGDSLKFFLRYFSEFGDSLDVLISTNSANLSDFQTHVVTLGFSGSGNNEWNMYKYALTDFVNTGSDIFIAFREHIVNTAIEGDALFLDLVEVSSFITGIDERPLESFQFELRQNYPNPFNPSTNINFSVPFYLPVTLRIMNILGQTISTVIENKSYPPGSYNIVFEGANLPSGIYYYNIEIGEFTAVKKMVLIK